MSSRSLGTVLMTFVVTSFGTIATASYGAGSNVIQLVLIPALGLSTASSILLGQNMGARKKQRVDEIAKTSLMISFVGLTVIGVLVFIFAPYIIQFFIPEDRSVIDGGAVFLRIISLFFGFLGLQIAVNGVFRASGHMMNTLILTLLGQGIVQFPVAYILSKHTALGVEGIWYSFPISYVVTAVVAYLWYLHGGWKKSKITQEVQLNSEVRNNSMIQDAAVRRG